MLLHDKAKGSFISQILSKNKPISPVKYITSKKQDDESKDNMVGMSVGDSPSIYGNSELPKSRNQNEYMTHDFKMSIDVRIKNKSLNTHM